LVILQKAIGSEPTEAERMKLTTYTLLALLGACEDADEIAVLMAIVRLGAWKQMSCFTTPSEIGRTLGRSPLWVHRVCRTLSGKPHPLLQVNPLGGRGDDEEHQYILWEPPGNMEGPLPRGVRE
jgi:hypothetical protein